MEKGKYKAKKRGYNACGSLKKSITKGELDYYVTEKVTVTLAL